jgi:hypothetical protein
MAIETTEPRPCYSGLGGFAMEGAALAAHKTIDVIRLVARQLSGESASASMTLALESPIEEISTPNNESAALSLAKTAVRENMSEIPGFYSHRA